MTMKETTALIEERVPFLKSLTTMRSIRIDYDHTSSSDFDFKVCESTVKRAEAYDRSSRCW